MNPWVLLQELYRAELELRESYARAQRLYSMGGLTKRQRAEAHYLRNQVYSLQMYLYNVIVAVIDQLPVDVGVPQPTKLPDLPPAQIDDIEALGALPAAAWAGLVIATLVAIGGVVIALRGVETGGDVAKEFVRVREDSQRYHEQLIVAERRFSRCLEKGKSPDECAGIVEIPEPGRAQPVPTASVLPMVGVGVASAAVGALGIWFYKQGAA